MQCAGTARWASHGVSVVCRVGSRVWPGSSRARSGCGVYRHTALAPGVGGRGYRLGSTKASEDAEGCGDSVR